MPCFPLAAWAAPACLFELGESQWNPGGDSAGTPDTPIPEGKTPHGSQQLVRSCRNIQGCMEKGYRVFCKLVFQGFFFLFCRTTNNLARFVNPRVGAPLASRQELPLGLQFCVWGTFPQHTRTRGTGTTCTEKERCTRDSHAAFLLLTSFIIFWFTVTYVLFHNIPDHAAIPAHFGCLSEAQLPVLICRQCISDLLQMCA